MRVYIAHHNNTPNTPSSNYLLDIIIKPEVHENFRIVNILLLSILPDIIKMEFRIFFRDLSTML